MHVKRAAANKSWPIPRKGTKYLIVPSHNKKSGIPLLIVMRDILKLVKTKKELKKALLEGNVLVNTFPIRKENYSLTLFDNISLPLMKKYFKLTYTNTGKINFEEISEAECEEKTIKVLDKKILKKNIVQLNFSDGRNLISKEKISVGDSIIIKFKDMKIEKILPIKEKANVLVIKGKHKGKLGIISDIENNEIIVKSEEKELKINLDNIIVI